MSRRTNTRPSIGTSVNLWPYQLTTVNSIFRDYKKALKREGRSVGVRASETRALPFCRPLAVLPTGSGKSICFLELAWRVLHEWGWKTLVVVPSRHLVTQIIASAKDKYPGLKCERFSKAHNKLGQYDVIVTTAAGMGSKWRSKIPRDYFGLAVYDEAHHLPARTFGSLFRHFSGAEIACGFTATHVRGDGESVADSNEHFSHICSYFSMTQLTADGYLAPVVGVFVDTDTSLAGVPQSRGDYVESALSRVVNNAERNALVVRKWKQYARPDDARPGRPTLVFAVDVEHARELARCFQAEGIAARAVWGALSDEERQEAVDDFLADRLTVLVNVRIYTEGIDLRKTSCVINSRPMTPESLRVLGTQIVGRGTRLSPETGKIETIYLELLDKDRVTGERVKKAGGKSGLRHGGAPRTLATPKTALHAAYGMGDFDLDPSLPVHLQSRIYQEKRAWYERQLELQAAKDDQSDLIFDIAERIAAAQYFSWMPLGSCGKFMMLGSGDFIELTSLDVCSFVVRVVHKGMLAERREFSSRGEALSFANGWLRENFLDDDIERRTRNVTAEDWRSGEPTELHWGMLHSLTGKSRDAFGKLSCGQVCDLIQTIRALEAHPDELKVDSVGVGVLFVDSAVQMGLSYA